MGMDDRGARRDELAASLARVTGRISAACLAAGRPADAVRLVAVTKTYPASDVLLLAGLGVTEVGENKDQDAAPKAAAVRAAGADVRWHFVGRLQRNKARSVVTYADVVQSVDSVRLVTALDRAAAQLRHRPLEVLVQVSIDGDPSRGGALPDSADPDAGVAPIAAAVAGSASLRLGGVMAVARLGTRGRVRPARRGGGRPAGRSSGGDRRVGGDERRSGGGRAVRSDTRTYRQRFAREAPWAAVA
jgi:PLP dependent protein